MVENPHALCLQENESGRKGDKARAPGGRLIFVGLVQADIAFHDPHFHRRELTVLSSRNALPGEFTAIIQLIEAGKIDTGPWITHRAALADVPARFESWTKPETGVIKAMIEVE